VHFYGRRKSIVRGGYEKGKGKNGAKGERKKTQEEKKGRRTKLAWTSERVRKITQMPAFDGWEAIPY
jgi:hypothetical protein